MHTSEKGEKRRAKRHSISKMPWRPHKKTTTDDSGMTSVCEKLRWIFSGIVCYRPVVLMEHLFIPLRTTIAAKTSVEPEEIERFGS